MARKLVKIEETTLPNIADAIRAMNGTTTEYLPSEMPDAIKAIATTPTPSTPVDTNINPGETATVPSGYYESSSKVTANKATTADQIDDTLKTAGTTESIVPGGSTTVSGSKYYTSDTTISASLATTTDQIDDSAKETKTVDGSLTEDITVTPSTNKVLTSVTVTKPDMSNADVTESDILNGKKAYGADGTLITGNITASTPVNDTINPGDSTTIPVGYYTSTGTVTANKATTADQIDDTLKTAGTTESIVPGGSTTVSGGKYYTSDTTISASLATTGDQIDSTIKAPGVAKTLNPGESYTLDGNIYRTSDTTISASLATTGDQIDDSIKLGAVTYEPSVNNQTISAGKYLSGDQTIAAITADNIPSDLKETQTITAPLTGSSTVTPTTGKVMTSVTVNAPDMSDADVNAADIVSGKKAYGADGTLITGTHTEAGGTDTSDATATASDIISGKTAYIADGKTTGTLEVLNYYTGTSTPSEDFGEVDEIYIQLES